MNSDITEMVTRNLNLVPYVMKVLGVLNKYDDYIDIGWIGLVAGCRKYDSSKDVKESTFLCDYIKYYILNQLLYERRQMRNNNDIEIVSFDMQVIEDESFYDCIPSDFNLESEFNVSFILQEINNVLTLDMKKHHGSLNHVDVVKDIFGIGVEKMAIKDIALKYNVSRETIQNVRDKFRKKLRKRLEFILD